jgi:hypothetical protein
MHKVKRIRGMAMRLRTGLKIMLGALSAVVLLCAAVYAQAPTSTPSPAPEGIVPAVVHGSTSAAGWLTGVAVEYAGSPLWTTLAGIAIIVLVVSLILWLRRPRKPADIHAPL